MQINVLEYLERTALRFPQKTAFADDDGALSFSQLQARAQGLGSLLAAELAPRTPVPVLLEKSPGAVAAFQMCIRDSPSTVALGASSSSFSMLPVWSGSVSYTHLDVYKRQA